MSKSKSSGRWLDRQRSDPYVTRAKAAGYRSRAAFKLLEIQEKDRILMPGMRVLDLGAAPGGWSQVAAALVGPAGRVLALDLLPMEPPPGVACIRLDFRDDTATTRIREALDGGPVDVVLSDLAPNMSGNLAVDQARSMLLAELAWELARQILKPGGTLVVKCFQGEGFDAFLKSVRTSFARVASRKPKSSRTGNRELYLVATGFAL